MTVILFFIVFIISLALIAFFVDRKNRKDYLVSLAIGLLAFVCWSISMWIAE